MTGVQPPGDHRAHRPRPAEDHDPLTVAFTSMWAELAPIGRDDRTGGYHRSAWTAVDRELGAWFGDQAAQRGMALEEDRNGNQWAWWGAPGAGAVISGSHLDSVPGGGAFDGPLGVVSAFLAVDQLRDQRRRPVSPLAVVRFVDEEGARFGVACAGSRLSAGRLDPDVARALSDADGVSLAEAMRAAGRGPAGLGRDDASLARVGAFVELHIEQGRGLADVPAAIGLASDIWPHGRWHLQFTGAPDHAGTTRLVDRHDPLPACAETVLAARAEAARSGALATIGKAWAEPGAANGIAAEVHAWLDCRAPDEETVSDVVAAVRRAAEAAAAEHRVTVAVTRESYTPAVRFDAPLRDRLQGILGGIPVLATGAGHDAGILASVLPTAMLFVRNPSGVSHSPAEHANVADCVAGIRALTAVLADLACSGQPVR